MGRSLKTKCDKKTRVLTTRFVGPTCLHVYIFVGVCKTNCNSVFVISLYFLQLSLTWPSSWSRPDNSSSTPAPASHSLRRNGRAYTPLIDVGDGVYSGDLQGKTLWHMTKDGAPCTDTQRFWSPQMNTGVTVTSPPVTVYHCISPVRRIPPPKNNPR